MGFLLFGEGRTGHNAQANFGGFGCSLRLWANMRYLKMLQNEAQMARQSSEKYPGQRRKEKRELFRPFVFRIVEDHYKRKFFELFSDRCFKCGQQEKLVQELSAPPNLCIDHHIPMALGGHLVPGNLVSLCRRCNGLKLDHYPALFYTDEELVRLLPSLEAQHNLFAFKFNWDKWNSDREAYLLEIGIDRELVHAALHDEDFIGYIGTGDEQGGIQITFQWSGD